jgi:hypothetical protein
MPETLRSSLIRIETFCMSGPVSCGSVEAGFLQALEFRLLLGKFAPASRDLVGAALSRPQ